MPEHSESEIKKVDILKLLHLLNGAKKADEKKETDSLSLATVE